MSASNPLCSQSTMVKVNLKGNILAALEPDYKVTFFHLHGGFRNGIALPKGSTTKCMQGKNNGDFKQQEDREKSKTCKTPVSSGAHPLHTAAELRQPLHQAPSPRSGHLLLPCTPRRSLILYGGLGVSPTSLLNDTWEYLIDEQRWVELICHGIPASTEPPSRVGVGSTGNEASTGHDGMPPPAFGICGTLFAGGRVLFVHGGITDGTGCTDHPAYQLDIERRLWTRLRLTMQMPDMWGSVAQTVRIPRHPGYGSTNNSTHYTSCNNSENKSDKRRDNSIKTGKGPNAGVLPLVPTSKQSIEWDEVVVLFGGMQGERSFNTTYFLYLTAPPSSSTRRFYREGDRRVVEVLPLISPSIFPGRRRSCSAVSNDFFCFIFGGRDSTYFYNDLWILNAYTRQWVMVRRETPLRYMRDFFLHPYDPAPGRRAMEFVKNILKIRRDPLRCKSPTPSPHICRKHNSSALWRTGAVMVCCGSDIIVHGGFTFIGERIHETHRDVHVYNYMRHVWRRARVDTDCAMSPFPTDYFNPPKTTLSGPQSENVEHPSLLNTMCSRNWELVKDIPPCVPVGRTMAAMCADPILGGFRFFLFGGRSEDEPSGDFYDVRIAVDYPARHESTWGYVDNFRCNEDIHVASQADPIHDPNRTAVMNNLSNTTTTTTTAVGFTNTYSDADASFHSSSGSRLGSSNRHALRRRELHLRPSPMLGMAHWVTPEYNVRCGQRRLWEQGADWIRALLTEEAALRRANALAVDPKRGNVVEDALMKESHVVSCQLRVKVDGRLPGALRDIVKNTPPFIWGL